MGRKNEGFGIAGTSEGVEFYVHSSKLCFDGRDLLEGATVKFEVRTNGRQDLCDKAIKVELN